MQPDVTEAERAWWHALPEQIQVALDFAREHGGRPRQLVVVLVDPRAIQHDELRPVSRRVGAAVPYHGLDAEGRVELERVGFCEGVLLDVRPLDRLGLYWVPQ